MNKEIRGDFDLALVYLINFLIDTGQEKALAEWDRLRGSDWYTSTKKRDQGKNE